MSGQKISYLDHWWWRDIGNNWRHVVLEFEAQVVMKTEEKSESQQTPGFQKRFLNHATNSNEEFHEPRNPFEDAHEEKPVQISIQNAIDQFLIKTIGRVKETENGQLHQFIMEKLTNKSRK